MHNQEAFSAPEGAAIIVAAGSGLRLGGQVPKQFLMLGGKPVLRWSVEVMLRCNKLASVIVVAPPAFVVETAALLPSDPRLRVIPGSSDSRTESVRSGLKALSGNPPAKVLIHDAARPGLTLDVLDEILGALSASPVACPAMPVTDALKDTRGGGVRSIARDGLFRVQTPQGFQWDVISSAYAATTVAAVDDLTLVEARGAKITLTPGREALMKITYPEDLAVAEKLIASPALRVGTGFDVHGFEPGDAVILCGVRIPHTRKLEGHSDADAAWHALTDAILGALALGDIGDHFPPSDSQWKGAPSVKFLKHAVKLAHDRGFRITNADITILAERPKISPHREAMRLATAGALDVAAEVVSVKATTTEKLGFVGREEGIAAQAVVLLSR
jgi:2-C-methyl-D-erythritol 4-phosphate cytidylyltransferase/2-C-methyl-D-erythritol 2,4-cyclodiphosphate synthase